MPYFAYIVGGWVQKEGKMCLRNKSMAPKHYSYVFDSPAKNMVETILTRNYGQANTPPCHNLVYEKCINISSVNGIRCTHSYLKELQSCKPSKYLLHL